MSRRLTAPGLIALAAMAALAVPGVASAHSSNYLTSNASPLAGTTLYLADEGDTEILERIGLRGRVPIAGPNQWVTVNVRREGKLIRSRTLPTDPVSGRFRMRMKLTGCCNYVAQAIHGTDVSESVPFSVSGPPTLEQGPQARYFNYLLRRNGYHMGYVTDHYDESTALAIMALRKVHDMERTEYYSPELY